MEAGAIGLLAEFRGPLLRSLCSATGEGAENGDAADVVVVEAAAAAAATAHMCRVIEPYQMLRLMVRRLHQ